MADLLISAKSLEDQLWAYDNAEQVLDEGEHDASWFQKRLKQLQESSHCEVKEVRAEDAEWSLIIGRHKQLKLRGAYTWKNNPNVVTEGYVVISVDVLDSEWTDGGEGADWHIVDRDSVKITRDFSIA